MISGQDYVTNSASVEFSNKLNDMISLIPHYIKEGKIDWSLLSAARGGKIGLLLLLIYS